VGRRQDDTPKAQSSEATAPSSENPEMKTGLTVLRDDLAKMAAGIQKLATTRVLVGVPADKAGRKDGSISNAALAYIHNVGAPEANIPARPFMEPGVEAKGKEIRDALGKAGELALDGGPEAVDRQFHRVGAIGRDAIKAKITDGPFEPLKPATIAARKSKRKSRKNTDIKPLIDTAAMRNSIDYVLKKTNDRS
jgi:hypothetical protein